MSDLGWPVDFSRSASLAWAGSGSLTRSSSILPLMAARARGGRRRYLRVSARVLFAFPSFARALAANFWTPPRALDVHDVWKWGVRSCEGGRGRGQRIVVFSSLFVGTVRERGRASRAAAPPGARGVRAPGRGERPRGGRQRPRRAGRRAYGRTVRQLLSFGLWNSSRGGPVARLGCLREKPQLPSGIYLPPGRGPVSHVDIFKKCRR